MVPLLLYKLLMLRAFSWKLKESRCVMEEEAAVRLGGVADEGFDGVLEDNY